MQNIHRTGTVQSSHPPPPPPPPPTHTHTHTHMHNTHTHTQYIDGESDGDGVQGEVLHKNMQRLQEERDQQELKARRKVEDCVS